MTVPTYPMSAKLFLEMEIAAAPTETALHSRQKNVLEGLLLRCNADTMLSESQATCLIEDVRDVDLRGYSLQFKEKVLMLSTWLNSCRG